MVDEREHTLLGPPPSQDPLRWWFDACRGSTRITWSLSLELRWFGWGDPPVELGAVAAGGRGEVRTDRYAPIERDDVSIKLRGRSRLAIKQRRARLSVVEGLPPAERWSRRTGRTPLRWTVHHPSWVPIAKRRSRLLVDLSGEPAVATGRRAAIARGGAVEVAELEVPGAPPLWTAACETWGPADVADLARLVAWPRVDWSAVHAEAWLAGGYACALRQLGDDGG